MTDVQLPQLQRMVATLTDDLRKQVAGNASLHDELDGEWKQAQAARRTAATFETWLDDILDQAAVAWVLGCVFVRFCEDNKLVDGLWIGGPDAAAPADSAAQQTQAYLTTNFRENERDWLRLAFRHLGGLPGTRDIFNEHNPVWRFDISGRAALDLLEKLRRGIGVGSLVTETLDTRFLGDLYQDLSTHAKKTYALLQTPEFVEEFILDRAFEPALAEFGLAEMKMIDPACGSGHFVLGAFHRLINRWREREPDADIRVLTQRALDQVTGVDINPFAVAIARFRLLVAALRTCGLTSLENAPNFRARLAAGDALLGWSKGEEGSHQGDLLSELESGETFAYYTEDGDLLARYLEPGLYTVVIANPPYITVKDKALNDLYRELYTACSGKYALTVPFAQRLFGLAKRGDHGGDRAGWIGQITANSFMKREFGRILVEDFFAGQVELTEVIDTSGAYIPGHGTPTVILVGRNRWPSPRYSPKIRSVLGIRGENTKVTDPSKGSVWSAIKLQITDPGSQTDWVSSIDLPRDQFAHHPWSLSGGGASELLLALEKSTSKTVAEAVLRIGFYGILGADDAMISPKASFRRRRAEPDWTARIIVGDEVRDWCTLDGEFAFHPYDSSRNLIDLSEAQGFYRWMWPLRTELGNRSTFTKGTYFSDGRAWWEWHQIPPDTAAHKWAITFASIATHNHFSLDQGSNIFKQSSPLIKLPKTSGEAEHLKLLGILNSSTACFWLKQVSHSKGNATSASGMPDQPWSWNWDFTSTKLKSFPLPSDFPIKCARELNNLAQKLGSTTPAATIVRSVPTRDLLTTARTEYDHVRARMITTQEELDWETYRIYGITEEGLFTTDAPELQPGERAFEIVLARRIRNGELASKWFTHHGFKAITEVPGHWPAEYRALVEKRIALIESDRNIGLIERPECKRRWQTEGWDAMQQKALRGWLLDRLEAPELWAGVQPTPLTVAQLADKVRHDEEFRRVLDLWVGNDQYDPAKVIAKLVADEHVPYLPTQRYKKPGLRKRAQWERTWALQRREDEGEDVGTIPVPPKYTSADFAKPSYWRNRGKLDVPKERFVSYPNASPDTDGTLLLGWAGWDHVQHAQALAGVYVRRKESRWPTEKLLPLLAGIAELEPWLHQWYTEPRDDFPMGSPAEFFTGFLDTELATLNADRATLTTLRGVEELS